MIPRTIQAVAQQRFARYPVLTITGPRQSGKTILCRQAFANLPYSNLEDPDTRQRASLDPRSFLATFPDGAVLDEVQRVPALFSALQVLVDGQRRNSRFVLSGSHNFQLHDAISQSLAGRTSLLELLPPSLEELRRFANAPTTLDAVLFTGAYPRIHDQGIPVSEFASDYVRTYVERDVRLITNVQDLATFQTFVRMSAAHSGRMLNLSALASDCGVTQPTAKSWLSVLEASYLTLRVQPWHRNLGKRLLKAPKLFLLDSGLLCWLLGLRNVEQLDAHPLRGAVFETWVVSEIVKARWNRGIADPLHFHAERSQSEVDLVIEQPDRIVLVEVKSGRRVAPDADKHLQELAQRLKDATFRGRVERVVVYGGDIREERLGTLLLPWSQVPEFAWW